MRILLDGKQARLQGDLTLTGMTCSTIGSLVAALEHMDFEAGRNIRIDCEMVNNFDIDGLHLLHVWMECLRFKGIEPELVNVSEWFSKFLINIMKSAPWHEFG